MHTGIRLDLNQFTMRIGSAPAELDSVFGGFDPHDRFGLVVDRPVGGVGASLLLQLAIALFYDADSRRRGRVYPEAYVFHVGGWHGSFGWYDVFPLRKEVVLDDDPAVVLEAINDRGITRLAVVDRLLETVRHRHQEPATALQRIRSAFAYSPSGRVASPDFELSASDRALVENTEITLVPDETAALQRELIEILPPIDEREDFVPPQPPPVAFEVLRRSRSTPGGLSARPGRVALRLGGVGECQRRSSCRSSVG